jgi:hypothetical protein
VSFFFLKTKFTSVSYSYQTRNGNRVGPRKSSSGLSWSSAGGKPTRNVPSFYTGLGGWACSQPRAFFARPTAERARGVVPVTQKRSSHSAPAEFSRRNAPANAPARSRRPAQDPPRGRRQRRRYSRHPAGGLASRASARFVPRRRRGFSITLSLSLPTACALLPGDGQPSLPAPAAHKVVAATGTTVSLALPIVLRRELGVFPWDAGAARASAQLTIVRVRQTPLILLPWL